MARTAATIQELSVNGKNVTFAAPPANGTGNGITINNTDGRVLLLINSSNTTLTPIVTLVAGAQAVAGGYALANQAYTIPVNATGYVIWLNPALFADAGIFSVDFSSTALQYAVVHLPPSYS